MAKTTTMASERVELAEYLAGFGSTIRFCLNGRPVELDGSKLSPEATLLDFIRAQPGLKGTKLGCGEGGCGACTVVYQVKSPLTGKVNHLAVNACLAPLLSVDGKHIITTEALGTPENPHPVQERMAKMTGSQCGFCTPGIVMSIYALLRNADRDEGYRLTPEDVELQGALDGNLCRCTGYRPILDAAKSFVGEYLKAKGRSAEGFEVPINLEQGHLLNPSEYLLRPCDAPIKKPHEPAVNGGAKVNGCGRKDCCQLNGSAAPADSDAFPRLDLKPYVPGTELLFPPSLSKHVARPIAYGNAKRLWVKPSTLAELLRIKAAYPSAKLVGGSSEVQIEIKFKSAPYDVCVYVGDLAELQQVELPSPNSPKLVFGGNLPLIEVERLCEKLYKDLGEGKASALEAIRHQLRYFAGRQIRNVASAAGNIATASPISDLNPVLLAAGATVVVASEARGESSLPIDGFFVGYRRTSLPPDAVIVKVEVPLDVGEGERELVKSYKQARRKDDDIAIVTAGFNVRTDATGVVTVARLAYGGMAPTTLLAKRASRYLVGKELASKATLDGTMAELLKDFDLPYDVPGGMATYRRSLAISFFFRYWHELVVKASLVPASDLPDLEDIVNEIHRSVSGGSRDNSDPYAQEVLGRQIPHTSALLHSTGTAVYTDDIPKVGENEAYGALVVSSRAHAKILNVDPSAALALDDVIDWVDHRDLPTPAANYWGPSNDEPFFAVDEVFTQGQPIGLILATTRFKAQEAAKLVKVDYEDLPRITTIEEAIEQDSFFAYQHRMKRGKEIGEAMAEAEFVLEGESRMGGQEHFYLETNAAVVIPKLEQGEVEVWSSTQALTDTQKYVARVLGVPHNRVVTKVKRMGGGFGGKETRSCQLACILAVGAQKNRRAVRCMLDRDMDMQTSGQRHPFLIKWKVGFSRDGRLHALDAMLYSNAGWTMDLSGGVTDRALAHIDNCYNCPNVDVRGRCAKTNTMSNTAFRGFGGPQGMFAAESYISAIAEHLKLDIDHVRSINLYKEGDRTHFLQLIGPTEWHVPRLLDELKVESDYEQRKAEIKQWNAKHRYRKRGICMMPTKFGLAYGLLHMNQGAAVVHIYTDGSVLVAHGGTEMGQNLFGKCVAIAAQTLGVPLSSIFTSETASNVVPNMVATAASSGTDLNGMAVKLACEELKHRLAPYRKEHPEADMAKIAEMAFKDRVSLSAQSHYRVPDIGYEWGNYVDPKKFFNYFTQGAACSEVEIDCLTGDHTILRADLKFDIGKSANPGSDFGQVEGAYVQGVGLYTLEEPLWLSSTGTFATTGPGTYKIPGFADVPQVFNVSFLRDASWPTLNTVGTSKGIGEPPLFAGASCMWALRDAIQAARDDAGITEPLEFRSPLTSERIRLGCGDDLVKMAEVAAEGKKSFFIAA